MNPKDQFDACMKLADFGAGRWDARRRYEWSLSLGVWALLAAAIGTLRIEALPIWIGIAAFALYAWWLHNAWRRNKWERDFMWHFLFEAQQVCEKYEIKTIPKATYLGAQWFILDWSVQFQACATLLLIFMVYLVCPTRITFLETAINLPVFM